MDLIPPLFFDAVLGFIASVLSRRAALRFMAWWLIPFVVSFLAIGPRELITASGEQSDLWLVAGGVFMLGCVASGVGTVLGYFLRRSPKSKA